MNQVDWQAIAPEIALQLLGEPNFCKKATEWRWGNHGSMVFQPDKATFYDHEEGDGGGVVWLINHLGKSVEETLKQFGYDRSLDIQTLSPPKKDGGRSLSVEQMRELYQQAIVKVQYAPNFHVMRFPETHWIKQKYAPFSLNTDGTWSMKRPSGLLPLYVTDKHKDKPVIVNEGEKAMRGCARIYDYDCACWHGGATGWDKTDWSALYDREVVIFPDKDDAGLKAASEIAAHLKANNCNVRVVNPPKDLAEKDDLWDAAEKDLFKNSKELEDYIAQNPVKPPRGMLHFQTVDEIVANITEPDWLIEGVFERGSVASLFGKPKSGKSFIGIAMACAIATGKDFYGHKAQKATVAYIAGEGNVSISRRFCAYQQFYNVKLGGQPLLISNRGARILDDEDFKHLQEVLRAMEAQTGSIGCIVLDTLARTFGGGDENSTSDMNKYIQRIDELKEEFNATILIVHHTGHGVGTRSRGSSVLPAALDYEFKIDREDSENTMFVTMKQTLVKDGMAINDLFFKFVEISPLMGFENMTSGVLKVTEEKPKLTGMTKKKQETIEAIEQYQLLKNAENPVDVWVAPTVLAAHMNINKKTLQSRLTDLLEADLIHHDKERGGYQSKKWDSEVF